MLLGPLHYRSYCMRGNPLSADILVPDRRVDVHNFLLFPFSLFLSISGFVIVL